MAAAGEARAALLLPVLVAVAGGPPRAVQLQTSDPLGPLLTVLGLLAWACAGWLLLLLVLAAAERAGSQLAPALLGRVAPASLRGLAHAALGAAVALAVATEPVAAEQRPPAASDLDLDWGPVAAPVPPERVPALPTRTPSARPTASPAIPTPQAADRLVVVRAGDSLWRIAGRALGPQATAQQIARAWPRWWLTNRAQLGPHPDLIHPGAVLTRPQGPSQHQGER